MVEELVAHLSTNGVGTVGTNLFAHVLPEEVSGVTVGVFDAVGMGPQDTFGGEVAWEQARVQVIVRSTAPGSGMGVANPVAARAKAQQAWDVLHDVVNTTIGGSFYLSVDPSQSPYLMQRDAQGRALFGFTADVWRRTT